MTPPVDVDPNYGREAPPDPEAWITETDEREHPDDRPGGGAPALGKILGRSQLSTLPKITPLVKGVLSQPAAVVLIGSYGTGKSVLVHGLASAVATGRPWLGQPVERRRTLIVVGEGANGLDDRIGAWEGAWNDDQLINDDDLTFIVKPDTFRNRNTWQQLTELALTGGYGFIILDTFSSLAPDADEVKDSPLIMRHLSDLSTAINGTVVLVHHPGWGDSTRARGGYQLEANADEVLILTGIAGEELVSLTRKKVKDGHSGATIWLRRRVRQPTPRRLGTTSTARPSVIFEWAQASDLEVPLATRILTVLDACAEVGGTGPQLMTECRVEDNARSGFYAALKKLRNKTHVKATGSGKSLRYYATAHAPGDAE